jgi:hypothetical protein
MTNVFEEIDKGTVDNKESQGFTEKHKDTEKPKIEPRKSFTEQRQIDKTYLKKNMPTALQKHLSEQTSLIRKTRVEPASGIKPYLSRGTYSHDYVSRSLILERSKENADKNLLLQKPADIWNQPRTRNIWDDTYENTKSIWDKREKKRSIFE